MEQFATKTCSFCWIYIKIKEKRTTHIFVKIYRLVVVSFALIHIYVMPFNTWWEFLFCIPVFVIYIFSYVLDFDVSSLYAYLNMMAMFEYFAPLDGRRSLSFVCQFYCVYRRYTCIIKLKWYKNQRKRANCSGRDEQCNFKKLCDRC